MQDFWRETLRSTRRSYELAKTPAFWRETLRLAKDDLQQLQWKRILCHIAALGTISTTFAWIVILTSSTPLKSDSPCQPDGTFRITFSNSDWTFPYNPFATSELFQITLGFGQRSFSDVKLIDISWDIAIGRCGQAIMAFISYQVFTKALLQSAETSPVTYDTFCTIALRDVSLAGLFVLCRDAFYKRGLRTNLTLLWIVISASFVLIFPTLVGAMTGYSVNTQASVLARDGREITKFSELKPVQGIINDGSRIGLDESYFIPSQDGYWDCHINKLGGEYVSDDHNKSCSLQLEILNYVTVYGYDGLNRTSSIFHNAGVRHELPAPSLNISLFPADTFAYNGSTYDLTYIQKHGRCTQLTTYQWGFSLLLLLITTNLTTLWVISTYALWLDAYFNSRFDNSHWDMGTYRAVLDLAAAMSKEIGNNDDDKLNNLSDHELKKQIQRDINGGKLKYNDLDKRGLPQTRATEIKRWWRRFSWRLWIKEEKWWIAAECSTLSFFIGSLFSQYLSSVPFFILSIGIIFARLGGRHMRTRGLFVVFFIVLAFCCWDVPPRY